MSRRYCAPARRLAFTCDGSRWSDAAVDGISCRSPTAPTCERAVWSTPDSTCAIATSKPSGSPASCAAATNAGRNVAGSGHLGDGSGVDGAIASRVSVMPVWGATMPRAITNSATAPTMGRLTSLRRPSRARRSARRRSDRRWARAARRSSSARDPVVCSSTRGSYRVGGPRLRVSSHRPRACAPGELRLSSLR